MGTDSAGRRRRQPELHARHGRAETATFEIRAKIRTYTHDSRGPSGSGSIIAKDSGTPDVPAWWLRVRDNKVQFYVCHGTTERSVYSADSSPIADNEWHSMIAKRDAATNKLLLTVDGVTTSVVDGTTTLRNGSNVRIGNFNKDSRQFRGDMDYVQVCFYK